MAMGTTAKQRSEINIAIAAYLQSNGYLQSLNAFMNEAQILDENADLTGSAQVLERKFLTNARLQIKVSALEKQVQQLQQEVTSEVPTREKRKREEWIPRPPEKFELVGHRNPVTRVIFHPIYNMLVTSSDDGTLRVWDVLNGNCERTLTGHTNNVNDIAFNKKGDLLVSCSADMSAKIWDVKDGFACVKTITGHDHSITSVAFTHDNLLITASRDSSIKMWLWSESRCVQNFVGHESWVRMIRLHNGGKYMASCGNDKMIKIWGIDNRSHIVDLFGHENYIEVVAWAPNDVVNYAFGGKKPASDAKDPDVLIEGEPLILASAARDKAIRLWHVNKGICLHVITGHDNWIRGLVFHPTGKYLISVSDDKTMRTWCVEQKRQIKSMPVHKQFVNGVDFHSFEPYVATASCDTTAKIWECR
uniref:LisH domain-containing protein n=1 Tax=Panagrellus redivivus TaxID=6233 RepID=A0A7E4UX80_PANRE